MKPSLSTHSDATANDLFESLADQFTQQLRDGNQPDIDALADQHPVIASRIRTLFPMLVVMETGGQHETQLDPPPFPAAADQHLKQLGDFRIIREIGRGGMGIVYEAIQESLNRKVALKVLPHASMDARSIQRFSQEARLAAMLHHTNIVPVHGTGQQQGYSYFVMQYIEGDSLDRVLVDLKRLRNEHHSDEQDPVEVKDQKVDSEAARTSRIANNLSQLELSSPKPFSQRDINDRPAPAEITSETKPISTAALVDTKVNQSGDRSFADSAGNRYWYNIAQVALQVADGLSHAHSQGILHRDIKPSNLILDEAGSLWITDFGLAKLNQSVNLTRTGEVVGTLRYMPPEHFSGTSDQRSDIYGLGLTLYEMATLEPAFQSSDHRRLMAEVIECKPLSPRKINPRIPRDIETIILKAISLEPEKRYQSAAELATDLRLFLNGQPIKARPISSAERFIKWARRHPAIAGLSAMILVLTITGVAAVTWKWREADANFREAVAQNEAREKYFSRALDAVDHMLARVGSDKLTHVPRMSKIRQELLADALDFYTVFLNESDNDPSLRSEIGKVQRRAGDIQSLLGDREKALVSYQLARDIFSQLLQEFPDSIDFVVELAAVRASLSTVLVVQGQGKQAEEEIRQALTLLELGQQQSAQTRNEAPSEDSLTQTRPTDWNSLIADARYHLGAIMVTTQGNKPAIEELELARELFERLPDESMNEPLQMNYAKCLGSISQLYDGEGRIDEALTLGQQAVKRFQSLAESFPDVPEYRNAMANSQQYLSGVLARQGNFLQAIQQVESEIQQRQALTTMYPDVPDFQSSLSRTYAVHGGMLHQIGKETEAEKQVLKAVELAEELVANHPNNVSYLLEAGYVNQVMGANLTLTHQAKNEERALQYSKRSYELRKQVVAIRPNDRACQMDLATAARNYGAILFNSGDESGLMLQLGQEAIDICQASAENDPENADTLYQLAYNQISLSRMLTELGTEDPTDSLKDGIRSFNKLIEKQPDEPRHRLQLTRALDQLANLQFRSQELSQWEQTLKQANENMEQVIQRFGNDPRLVQFLTISKNRLGHCLKTRGQADQALELFQEALQYRQQVLDKDPSNNRGMRDAASAHRNLAWLYAKFLDTPDLEAARTHALKAVELDAENPNHWTALAYVYWLLGDQEKQQQAMVACPADQPTDQMARLALSALSAHDAGDPQEAQQRLSEALEIRHSEEVEQDFDSLWLKPELFDLVQQAKQTIQPQG